DFADDADLCQWIADTIPHVIEPGSWHGMTVSYQPRLCVIAFSQTPAVHVKVDEFLHNLKKALPQQAIKSKAATSEPALIEPRLVQAQFAASEVKSADPTGNNKSTAYPVPAPLKQPKHLFHFIIRYEGDGAI